MELNRLRIIDDQFIVADIGIDAGVIRFEGEIMPGGRPPFIECVTWLETGADAVADIWQQFDEMRDLIAAAVNEVFA